MDPVLHAFFSQTAPEGGGGALYTIAPLLLMFAVFYFVLIRPQSRQAKVHQQFLTGLKRGDEVTTQSGIIGTVVSVEDKTVLIDVGSGTKIRFLKGQVAGEWKGDAAPVKAEARK